VTGLAATVTGGATVGDPNAERYFQVRALTGGGVLVERHPVD
jgi:hypothetical protein